MNVKRKWQIIGFLIQLQSELQRFITTCWVFLCTVTFDYADNVKKNKERCIPLEDGWPNLVLNIWLPCIFKMFLSIK